MKNLLYCIYLAAMIGAIDYMYLIPNGIEGYKWYEARADTKIVTYVTDSNMHLDLPRFPGDMIIYSPIKFTKWVDVNVLDYDEGTITRNNYISNAIDDEDTFAFTYMCLLASNALNLPIIFESGDLSYDLSRYVGSGILSFNVGTLNIDAVSSSDKSNLFGLIGLQAQRDTVGISTITENSIVEVSNGTISKYLWCHTLTDKYAYVLDPTEPNRSMAKIDLATQTFESKDGSFKVKTIRHKIMDM